MLDTIDDIQAPRWRPKRRLRARELLKKPGVDSQGVGGLPALAASNLIADRIEKAPASHLADLLLAPVAAHRELSPERLTDVVNAERQVAGFPLVTVELVRPAYEELQDAQIAAALAALASAPSPGSLLEAIIPPSWAEGSRPRLPRSAGRDIRSQP